MLEVFGEHTLSAREMSGLLALSLAMLAGYGIHAKSVPFPLLKLSLFNIRTFRAAVSDSFFTRLGIDGPRQIARSTASLSNFRSYA